MSSRLGFFVRYAWGFCLAGFLSISPPKHPFPTSHPLPSEVPKPLQTLSCKKGILLIPDSHTRDGEKESHGWSKGPPMSSPLPHGPAKCSNATLICLVFVAQREMRSQIFFPFSCLLGVWEDLAAGPFHADVVLEDWLES